MLIPFDGETSVRPPRVGVAGHNPMTGGIFRLASRRNVGLFTGLALCGNTGAGVELSTLLAGSKAQLLF